MTDDDPLRTRSRPGGIRVDAEAATWESTVFAISVGASRRYLEVPAEQVVMFLAAVDAGQLDDELAGIAGAPTGATRDRPGRIRGIAAFDRVLLSALSRAERDPVTGQLIEPGPRQHKRQRDDDPASRIDHGSAASSGSSVPAGAAVTVSADAAGAAVTVSAAGTGVAAVATRSWWSSPVVAVGAVVAVVVVVAGTVFALTRPADEPATAAVAVSSQAVSSQAVSSPAVTESAESAAGPTAGPSDGPTAPITSPAAGSPTASAVPSPLTSSPAAGVPGSNNQFAGTYTFTRTVTANSGNADFPIGTTDSGSVTLTAACDEPTCAIDGERFGVPTISGNQLAFSVTGQQPCTSDPSITVTLAATITVDVAGTVAVDGVSKVGAMQGVGTLTVSDPAGCPGEIQPITYSYDLTRTG
jgi:hypothetical protein